MLNRGDRNQEKAQRLYFRIGLSVSLLVALILPAGYFALSYTYLSGALEAEADINATIISGVIKLNPEMWRYEQMRLEELLGRRPRHGYPETRRILDRDRLLVAESVNPLPAPVMTRRCELHDAGAPIGSVEISRSLFATLAATGVVGLVGATLGGGIFYLLWEVAFRRVILAEKQRREFIEKVMENGPHAVLVLDPAGGIVAGNTMGSTMSGLPPEKLVGLAVAELFDPEDAAAVSRHLAQVATSRVAMASFDARLARVGRENMQVSCTVSPLLLEGKVINLLACVQDISAQVKAHQELRLYAEDLARQFTKRKKVEEALRLSEARFRNLLQEVGSVAVRGYGPDGTTQYWNQASERLYGYSAQEAIGRNLGELLLPDGPQGSPEPAPPAAGGEPVPPRELTLRRKDGSQVSVFSSRVTVSLPDRTEEIFYVDIDLSERNKNLQEKAKLEAKLQQAQRMELIGRLAGGVAHDFNNMLTIIVGYASMALLKLAPDQPLHANFSAIYNAAERSANLTRQLFAFARRQAIEPRVLDLRQTVGGMIEMLQRLIGEGIQLAWRTEQALWPVKMDPSQVDQILVNLCVNARDAMAGMGNIAVEAENRSVGADYFTHLPWCAPGDYVRLCVTDNGCGIDQETLPHIFEPFYTTKGVGKGTGLGLATVYGIVKQNGGFINVQSGAGRGTSFEIYLPRYTGQPEESRGGGGARLPVRGRETILLVEDEPAVLELTREMLLSLEYRVLSAARPQEALALAREHHGEVDLILADLIMPEMNGHDLVRDLLGRYPHIKHLFMSGYSANLIESDGIVNAGIQFLHKPFSLHDLAAKVREVLDGAAGGSPEPAGEATGETP